MPKFPPIEAIRSTLTALDATGLEVYSATGLSPSWQQAFTDGRTKDPSYSKICILVDWLRTKHLDVFKTYHPEG